MISVLSVPFEPLLYEEALAKARGFLEGRLQHQIATPNPEFLVAATKNQKFQQVLQNASLNIPDGVGLLWAAAFLYGGARTFSRFVKTYLYLIFAKKRLTGFLPERIAGSDFMIDLCRLGYPVFLLGGAEGVANEAKEVLKKRIPGVNIVGAYGGNPAKEDLVALINQTTAQIVLVAFGAPKQDIWIANNLSQMPKVKIAMGVGGSLDFLVGRQVRAPKTMRKLGLEWLWRLVRQPSRWRRIWRAVAVFPFLIWINRKHA